MRGTASMRAFSSGNLIAEVGELHASRKRCVRVGGREEGKGRGR
jgi:hypothetical protein